MLGFTLEQEARVLENTGGIEYERYRMRAQERLDVSQMGHRNRMTARRIVAHLNEHHGNRLRVVRKNLRERLQRKIAFPGLIDIQAKERRARQFFRLEIIFDLMDQIGREQHVLKNSAFLRPGSIECLFRRSSGFRMHEVREGEYLAQAGVVVAWLLQPAVELLHARIDHGHRELRP